jgi:hypothetical protein
MKARLKVEKPDDIEFTMTITMKASEWEQLRDQLNTDWPSWKLTAAITSLLSDAGKEVITY